jgi:outer membrane protein OmpA-like peptidoglycan-associated protein
MALDRVVLYQSGLGHFEWRGRVTGDRLQLTVRPDELDDLIKTLVVTSADGAPLQAAAVLPSPRDDEGASVEVEVALTRADVDVIVTYATPAAAWKTTYRLALPDDDDDRPVRLQAWAMVDNVSRLDWRDVRLALATGAPLSFHTDLRTPLFAPRPDATELFEVGQAPRVSGSSAHGRLLADVDADGDRIRDRDDACPHDPETSNGLDDDDGCPDRERVIVSDSRFAIVDRIVFAHGAATIPPTAAAILDAVAAALQAQPDITAIDVEGHAAAGEPDAWGLAARRAGAVRSALLSHGVTQAMRARALGPSQPTGQGAGADRRVTFAIAARQDEDADAAGGDLPRGTSAFALATGATRSDVAGSSRHQLAERVTVPRGTSTVVAVASEPLTGETVLLYRPDPGSPPSTLHPFRAARVVLPATLAVEPGPIAVYAGGDYAGEALMPRSAGGETVLLPFAREGGTRIVATIDEAARPSRLLAIVRGVATVEDAQVVRTTYTIHAGARAPATIVIQHAPRAGLTLRDPPPGSTLGPDGALLPVPLTAGQVSTLVVEEQRPIRRRLVLLDDDGTALGAYVRGAALPPAMAGAVDAIVAARKALADADAALVAARARLDELIERSGELERSLRAVARLPGAEAKALRRSLIAALVAATRDGATSSAATTAADARRVAARIALQAAIERLTLIE